MFSRILYLVLISFLTRLTGQIHSPNDFFGYELGSNFSRHHQVVDNLLFRGFWYSGKQVFSNAVFF